MRISFLLVILFFFTAQCADQKKTAPLPVQVTKQPVPTDNNAKQTAGDFKPVAEILGRSCAPCHNPGGKMYATLPFDSPEIVSSHGSSILGRIKSPEDAAVLEKWLHTINP